MIFFRPRLFQLGLAALALVSAGVVAQDAATPAPPELRPTVTVADGDKGGMFFGRVPDAAKTRRYYIAAESALWDFAPAGRDEICGLPLPSPVVRNRKAGKLRYVQYTDATFTTRAIPERSLGIMGPALRGVVGEFLAVTFLNRTDQPLSMHPHGVKYDKDSEGAHYAPAPGRGAAVGPGARFTYVWQLDAAAGPLPGEPSSRAWLYHSHVMGDTETNLGLMGAIIVTDPARARPDGTPRDVDREFAALFMIFDESGLDDVAREAAEYGGLPGLTSDKVPSWAEVQQQIEQGARYAINGYIFGNLPGLQMNEGERVRWYLFGLGSEQDIHTAHWHGLRLIEEGRRRTDTVELLPATMKVADMIADNPGDWLLHCHVAEHMREGMFARVTVHGRDTVGVDRAPARAFLGYPAAVQSLRITRVERRPADRALAMAGVVTVFEGFAVFNEPVRVRVGGRSFEFHPDRAGVARADGATWRARNGGESGVILSGLMEFELTLPADVPAGGDELELVVEIARARHAVRVPVAGL